jgi:Chaperone of endosialidase
MTIPLIINNVTYDYPTTGDTDWGSDATGWALAVTNYLSTNISPLTAKGDIYTFSSLPARLPVGPNGTVLVSDTTSTTGLAWKSIAGVGGAVTGFSFVNANGFTGVVANPTTTPALTLSMATLPISGGGTGATTKTAAFNNLSPLTLKGSVLYHDGTNNAALQGNPVGKQYVLSNDGVGNVSWNLPTYGKQAIIATPCDLNALPTTDLSIDGYGDFVIQGITGNVSNRPPGSAIPMSGSNVWLGSSDNIIQTVYSSATTVGWVRRRMSGTWGPWQEAVIPDQTGQANKILTSDGTNAKWINTQGGIVTSVAVVPTNGIASTVTNPTSNVSIALSLTSTGVTAGTYTNSTVTIDNFGRITTAANGLTGTTTATDTQVGVNSYTAISPNRNNVVVGSSAFMTSTATGNVAVGHLAMSNANSTATSNVAVGLEALKTNTAATNVAVGAFSMNAVSGSASSQNVAVGAHTLKSGTNSQSVAVGAFSMANPTSSGSNTAVGAYSLTLTTNGGENTAIGHQCLAGLTTGYQNTAVGKDALNGASVTNVIQSSALGNNAGSGLSYNNVTYLGFNTAATATNQVQLGNSLTTTYAYGTVQSRSDVRDKADIDNTLLGLNFINLLRPVDFRYDYREDYRLAVEPLGTLVHDGSKKRTRKHHGLIAQEVKEVIDTLGIDFGGYQDHTISGGDDAQSIGYSELIAPMIKAIQQLSAKVTQLEAQIGAI